MDWLNDRPQPVPSTMTDARREKTAPDQHEGNDHDIPVAQLDACSFPHERLPGIFQPRLTVHLPRRFGISATFASIAGT